MRPPCGTPAGHAAHKRHNELACLPCADAKADYIRALRVRADSSRVVHVPVALLQQLLADLSPDMLAVTQASLGVRTVAVLRRTALPQLDEVAT